MVQGAELIPYNIDSILGQTSCIIHEGELDAASSIAAGFKSAISVPAGANSNLSWLDRFMETHFEDLEEIIIAVDADSAGIRLRNELINRLGAERCRVVTYGPECKDANEHLCKYGIASLRIAIEQAAEVPLEGIFTAADLHDDLRLFSTTASVPERKRDGRTWIRSARMNVGEVSTSPEFPVQENPSGWTNWCCVSACGINGKSGSLARKIPLSSIISAN